MKYLFLLIVVFVYRPTFSQNKFDKQIKQANTFFKAGDKQKAISLWQKVEDKADQSSVNYGKALRNLLFHYSQGIDERNLISYYSKIMKFKLNEVDKKEDVGETFLNTKYYSTMLMASFYKNRANFTKSLHYIDMVDESVVFHTNSISNYAAVKIDLAMSKYWIYIDLNKNDVALSKLIKRAFEYDYKAMYTNWYVDSGNRKELELSQLIYTSIEDINVFEKEIENAINSLSYDNKQNLIKLTIRGINYQIETYKKLDLSKSKEYLRESPFYQYLKTQNSMAVNN